MDIRFKLEKRTKNTVRYEEIVLPGKTPAMRTIYVANEALGKNPPEELQVTLHLPPTA